MAKGNGPSRYDVCPLRSIHAAAPLFGSRWIAGSEQSARKICRWSFFGPGRRSISHQGNELSRGRSATIFLSASRENGAEHDPSSVSDRICLVGLIFIYFSLIRASRCSLNILCHFRYYFKERVENIWFRLIDNIFLSPAIYFLITNIRMDKISSVRY